MAKTKQILYNDLQRLVKDKDTAVANFVATCYNRLQAMFVYTGVADLHALNIQALEFALQSKGHCIVAEVNGELYALTGEPTGELNAYYEPTQYIVANPWLKLNKTYTIGKDCVLFRNDYLMQGLQPVIGRYAVELTDTEISLNTAAVLSRITMLISAADDKTKASADLFLTKILNGDFSVIGENAFFDGVKLQTLPTSNTNYITQLIELTQYYKASMWHEMGLQANYNMKRERLTQGETEANVDSLLPLADAMLTERKRAVERMNEMFNTTVTVEFGSSWRTLHEEEERNNEIVNTQSDTHELPDNGTDGGGNEPTDGNPDNGGDGTGRNDGTDIAGGDTDTDRQGEPTDGGELETGEQGQPNEDEPKPTTERDTEGNPKDNEQGEDADKDSDTEPDNNKKDKQQ